MRIFYNKSVDEFARRLVPGIAVLALAAWGISSGGAVLEEVPLLTTAKAVDTTAATDTADEAGFTDGEYTDGTYTGTAPGFGGDVTVSVTIEDGKMAAIDIVSAAGETPSYLSRAKGVISAMLEAQSPNVDVVSGATFTSNGIINAVKNALIKAAGGTVNETTGSSGLGSASAGGSSGSTSSDSFTDADAYADGTYTGSAQGYGGAITVSVKISDGKINAISIVSASGETASYFAKAKAVINKVITAQSPNVDVVSGATYSSNGILNAIKKALNKAAAAASGSEITGDDTGSDSEKEKTYTDTDTEFYGIGYGYRNGRIVLKVTAQDGEIKAIDVIEKNNQDEPYFENAMEIIDLVQEGEKVSLVDTVSGATYSSKGILTALTEALNKAKIAGQYEGPIPATPTPDEEPDTEPDTEPETPEKAPEPTEDVTKEEFTYTGTALCEADEEEDFDSYNMTVKFTVTQTTTVITDEDGNTTTTVERKLTGVEVTNPTQGTAGSNWSYINRAINGTSKITGIAAQAIANQSFSGIDAVSNATCSSNAIIRAASQCDLNLGTTTK